MQRNSISDEAAGMSSPTYPAQMYDSSIPPLAGASGSNMGPGSYHPYPGAPDQAGWSSYPPPHGEYGQPHPLPPPGWYGPPPAAVAGPSAPPAYYPTSQSSSPYPNQGHFARGSFSGPSDFPQSTDTIFASQGKRVYTGDTPELPGPNLAKARNGSITATPSAPVGSKQKRRRKQDRDGSAGSGDAAEKEKRTKTGRACDACRTKKIRCDILPSADAMNDDSPICAHCKQYNLECTFFLPITETRFKKKKTDNDGSPLPGSAMPRGQSPPHPPAEVPGRIEGPTSLSFLLHTSLPASASEAYDLRYHNSWEISEDGNGLIRVMAPPSGGASRYAETNGAGPSDLANTGDPARGHSKLNRPILNAHTISLLVNAYFDHLAHLFPIISRSEFAAKQNPPPLLLYSICGLGATRRQFPREIFAGVRGVINGLLRSNDILSDARIENVQALLVLAQVGDLHAQPTAATASASLMRTGSAIRMAQDLGLHRESHLRAQTPQDLAYVELRRRIWATCVIMDRWYGAALGIPLHVDLLDCDVLLPAGYDIILDQDPSSWPIEPSFVALSEHLKLSILVGRVLKIVYSPTGLKHATDEQLYSLLEDMRAWKLGLPEDLQFSGPQSSFAAGLLHLSYATLHFLLWRPFMRITYICPPHLKFALETMHWSEMTIWASEALDWLHQNGQALDTVFIYAYTATSCALVQYHTWVRRREPASLESLKLVRETAMQWEATVQPDQMSIRRKTCETMTLLYEAALKTNPEDERPPRINPTAGVLPRPALGKAVWVADASKPYGGIWVAHDAEEKKDSGLTENSVVMQEDVDKSRPPPELESTHPAIRARAMSRLRGTESAAGTSVTVPTSVSAEGEDEGGSRRSATGSVDGDAKTKFDPQVRGDAALEAEADAEQNDELSLRGDPVTRGTGNGYDPALNGDNHAGGNGGALQHLHGDQQARLGGVDPAYSGLTPVDPMQILRDMQMAGSNVNPQIRDFGGSLDQTGGYNEVATMGYPLEFNPGYGNAGIGPGVASGPGSGYGYDPSLLDNLPANGFNFDQWNTWFSNIDRMIPQSHTTSQEVGGIGLAGDGPQHQQRQQERGHQQEGELDPRRSYGE